MKRILMICLLALASINIIFSAEIDSIDSSLEDVQILDENLRTELEEYIKEQLYGHEYSFLTDNNNIQANDLKVEAIRRLNLMQYTPMDLDFTDSKSYDELLDLSEIQYESVIRDASGDIINIAGVIKVNDEFAIGLGLLVPLECVKFYADQNNIKTLLENEGIKNILSIHHIRFRNLYTDVILVKAQDGYYGIPFGHKMERLNLVNFQLYKAEDVLGSMQDYYNQIYAERNSISYRFSMFVIRYREIIFSICVIFVCIFLYKRLN